MNIFTLLDQAGRRHPELEAVCEGDHVVLRYGALRHRSLQLGAALAQAGLRGERVVIASENCPAYIEALFGTWAAEATVVPVNAKLHPKEMLQIVQDADARWIFASPKLAPAFAESGTEVVTFGSDRYNALFGEPMAAPMRTAPESLAWLFYTSGTTGRSKGAMLSHRNLMAMTLAHLADVDPIEAGDSQLHAAPMSHGSGLYIPATVARAARSIIPASGGFEPAEFLALCARHPRCGAFLAPTMIQRLRLELERSGAAPPPLRSIVYGGGPMYVEELRKALASFGHVFVQIYGQGESPMTITWLPRADHAQDDPALLGSVGLARTGMAVRVVGADGNAVAQGEIGEVECRGDTVMAGYWRNPTATAEALSDGWLRTGDMGRLDARGYLTLTDRSKDVVISGGTNIYPREVEEVLLLHPGVVEACVVGQPDPEWGEVVVAFVVTAGTVSAEDLDGHCLAHIARFKRPKAYRFVPELPKNSYGKVLKRELRQQLAGG